MSQSLPNEAARLPELRDTREEAARLNVLRRDWRLAALKQWLRGSRLFSLVVAMASVPAMSYYIEHADGKTRWLDDIFSTFSLTIIGPVITVIFTLLALDGPRGIARVDDLRTIEGGPEEWVRALIFSARVCVLAVIAVWAGARATFAHEVDLFEPLLLSLAIVLSFLWMIPSVVGACRLRIPIPVIGSLALWGLSLWPGWMILNGELEAAKYRCGNPIIGALTFAMPFGYLLQGFIASRSLRKALGQLSSN